MAKSALLRVVATNSQPRHAFLRAAGVASLHSVLAALPARGETTGQDPPRLFELGDFVLRSGATLREAKLSYKTHGTLNADKSNAIVYPTPYSAHHSDIEWIIGPGKALDPDKYFIIVTDMLGNGLSASPSNTPPPYDRARFPTVTIQDNIAAQHRLVTEQFGIGRLALVYGWSMGAQQAYQWAVSHPDMVARVAASCGTARTTPHNFVFLEGVKAALTVDAAWNDGWYEKQPDKGLRAFARVYAGWGFSQPFYKQELWRKMGFSSLEDFLIGFWERRFLRRDANNLLTMLCAWQLNDVGSTPGFDGSLERALGSIKAKALVMPGQTDMYFTPQDVEYEAKMIPGAQYRPIPSIWGHQAGGGLNPVDNKFVDDALKELLSG